MHKNCKKGFLISALVLVGWIGGQIANANAQSDAVYSNPSAMHFLKGIPISPGDANSFYGASTTSTDGLCRDYATNAQICPTGGRPAAPEVKELARALNYDPDLIYDYMLNTIDIEFMFGAHKGALGAIVDRSAGAFDQAELMVALLREAASARPASGISSVQYVYGTVTLSGSDFYDWSGIQAAKAACEYLAAGGIPATVNGISGGCPTSGTVGSVVMSHVWVKATISGQTYFYDPSFKRYTQKAGINVRAAMGLVAGQPLAVATGGMQSGTTGNIPFVNSLNDAALNAKLTSMSDAMLTRLQQADMNGASVKDVIGGAETQAVVRPAAGWKLSQPSNYNALYTWDNIPNQFRASFSVYGEGPEYYLDGSVRRYRTATAFSGTFFADEVYGRRLELGTVYSPTAPSGMGAPNNTLVTWLQPQTSLDGVTLMLGPKQPQDATYTSMKLSINHPFAAQSGTYGDEVIDKWVDHIQGLSVVQAWGDVAEAQLTKVGDEAGNDWHAYRTFFGAPSAVDPDTGVIPTPHTSGDLIRAKMAAGWLGQFTRSLHFHERLSGGHAQHLHSFGFVSSYNVKTFKIWQDVGSPGLQVYNLLNYDSGVNVAQFISYELSTDGITLIGVIDYNGYSQALTAANLNLTRQNQLLNQGQVEASTTRGFNITNDVSIVDINSSIALTMENGSVEDREATLQAVAATAAALEGSIGEQMSGEPDGASTAQRFRWGNRPTSDETGNTTSRNVMLLSPTQTYSSYPLLFDGSTAPHQAFGGMPAVGTGIQADFMTRMRNALSGYLAQGYEIVASNETILGPGHIHGGSLMATSGNYSRLPSFQRGGAFVANKYNAAGEIQATAHVITRHGGQYKGGGGTVRGIDNDNQIDAQAGLLKSRFVERGQSLGVDLSSGGTNFSTGVLKSIGQGEFPYKLDLIYNGNYNTIVPRFPIFGRTFVDELPFKPSLMGGATFSDSPMDGMGNSRIEAMASTIVSFVAMQDIWHAARTPQRETVGLLTAAWWLDTQSANVLTVFQGAGAEQYVHIKDTLYLPAAGGAGKAIVTGQRQAVRPGLGAGNPIQPESEVRYWDYKNVTIAVVGAGGDTRNYEYWGGIPAVLDVNQPVNSGFRLKTWSFPQGVTLTYAYNYADSHQAMLDRSAAVPTAVSSSLGYSLDLPTFKSGCVSLIGVQACEATGWTFVDSAGSKTKLSTIAPVSAPSGSPFGLPVTPPTVTTRPKPTTLVDSIYAPSDPSTASIRYEYDSLSRVKFAYDGIAIRNASARPPYEFFVADGFRRAVKNPLGKTYGVETINNGRMSRAIDELGQVVVSTFDGRGRVLTRTYPEQDKEVFAYDAVDNVVELRKKPKPVCTPQPSCNPPDIVTSALYEPTWNKLSYVVDANGNRTDFTYYNSGNGKSNVQSVQRPLVNGARPTVSFTYYANGRLASKVDEINVTTSFAFDTKGNITQQVIDSGGLNLTTTYGVDAVGNMTSVTDPRGQVNYMVYDAMRRVTYEIGPDPDGAGAGTPLKRMIVHHMYDPDGREYRTEQGVGDATDGSDFVMNTFTQSTFDAVGNVVKTVSGVRQ